MWFESINQPGRSSEVENNSKMNILFFWLERGGGWSSSPSTSPTNHQKLNIIQKWRILFFWLERGGRCGLSPSTSPTNHQKLNIIQTWAFHIFGWRGVVDGVQVHISISILNWNSPVSCSGIESDNGSGSSASLVDGLKPHLPPLSSQKNKMLIFGLSLTSDDWPGWSMDSNPICHPSPAKKIKCSFLDYVQLLMISRAGQWTRTPSATPLQTKIRCSFLDYIQLLVIGRAGWWTRMPSATPLQPKKKCLFLDYFQLLMIGQTGWWTQTTSATPLQTKK